MALYSDFYVHHQPLVCNGLSINSISAEAVIIVIEDKRLRISRLSLLYGDESSTRWGRV